MIMKRTFSLMLLCFLAYGNELFAQASEGIHPEYGPEDQPVISRPVDASKMLREVGLSSGFSKMVINGDVNIILTSNITGMASIEGKPEDVKKVKIINRYGLLTIEYCKSKTGGKPLITIPVYALKFLEVNGDGSIYSNSVLFADKLGIRINGDCEVAVRASGDISVTAADGYELFYSKKERIQIVRE
jgi:Putative auto-transporter adhesin, head GIN domain